MLNHTTYVWRGHRCEDWALEPTFDRLEVAVDHEGDYRLKHLKQFQYASLGRAGPNPPPISDENEWWALGQHHGLSTPLLDWTLSPFIAAYFAFCDIGGGQTDHRAIFALARHAMQEKDQAILFDKKMKHTHLAEQEKRRKAGERIGLLNDLSYFPGPRPELEFIRPLFGGNPRLVNQAGLFTPAPDNVTIEDWVTKNFAGHDASIILMKLLVPDRDRLKAINMLNRMNINHLTLFPDLSGAARFCDMAAVNSSYSHPE